MKTRLATEADLPEIVRMGRGFWNQTDYSFIPYDDESIRWWSTRMLECELLVAIEVDGKVAGFVGAISCPMLGNMKWKCAAELFWWIDPEYRNAGAGLMLFRAFKDQAKKVGVHVMAMMCLESVEPEKATALYLREGMKPTERVFMQVLQEPGS
jgi:GNAT superfamily N-acetyltransferase